MTYLHSEGVWGSGDTSVVGGGHFMDAVQDSTKPAQTDKGKASGEGA